MNKLEFVRQVMTGEREFPPAGRLLHMKMIDVQEGSTTIEMPVRDEFLNRDGGVQGGFLASLADANMGTTLATVCDTDESHATVDIKLSFLRPARAESSPLRATAHVLYRGRTFAHTEGEIRSKSGELIAKATASWIIRRVAGADRE